MTALLELRDIRRSYPSGDGEIDVLKGITLSIAAGEMVAIVGASGSGKSTLMNILGCLDKPTSGTYQVAGVDVAHLSGDELARLRREHFGFIFQRYHLLSHLTAAQNVEVPAIYAGKERRIRLERARDLLTRLGLGERAEYFPSQLSGGQQQRVAMGRALARRPKVYLFDEPLSNLDAKLRVEMRTELKLMHQRLKTTTVYVTHDQIEAMTLGDKVAVMKDGVIQQFGTPQQIYNDPANLFVASFIGSPPMNFIPLRLQRRDGRWTGLLDSGQDRIELPLSLEPGLEEGRELILGVRPEQIALGDGSAAHDLRTEVEVLEPTGPDTLVFVTVNQVKVCCRLAPDVAPAAGSGMSLRFDPARVLLFDAQSGERVAVRTAGVAAEKVTALNGNRQKNS